MKKKDWKLSYFQDVIPIKCLEREQWSVRCQNEAKHFGMMGKLTCHTNITLYKTFDNIDENDDNDDNNGSGPGRGIMCGGSSFPADWEKSVMGRGDDYIQRLVSVIVHVKIIRRVENGRSDRWSGLVSLFYGISTFSGYLMPIHLSEWTVVLFHPQLGE